ncbi:JmjC domain-containing histone demethylation protein 1 [Terramyces sp. JEL0728]|nr:JmjC domain-containing histone demethylation protein 1 [Terramyces sp. JEL0728]
MHHIFFQNFVVKKSWMDVEDISTEINLTEGYSPPVNQDGITAGDNIDQQPLIGTPTDQPGTVKQKKDPKPKKPIDPNSIRKSEREKSKLTYQESGVVDEYKWTKILNNRIFQDDNIERVNGNDANMEWIYRTMLKNPVIFENPDGLDMAMPPSDLTVDKVAEICGPDRIVDVVQVATQTGLKMKLKEWAEYVNLPPEQRTRILNVISLEIGSGEFGKSIKRPKYVRQVDWIDNIWPDKTTVPEYPKVQLYCLMGVQDSYTDFHIDFGGSSVFYHVLSGEKVFYFIEPTKANLEIYKKWSMDPDQSNIFLGDLVKTVTKVRLLAPNTMHIPSGWNTPVKIPIIDLQQIQVLIKYLVPLSNSIDDFHSRSKNDRKLLKGTIPKGIKNIKLLLDNLNTAFKARLLDIPFAPELEWESDDSEMEFLDSNDEAVVEVDSDYSDGEQEEKKKRKKRRKIQKPDIVLPAIPNHSIPII